MFPPYVSRADEAARRGRPEPARYWTAVVGLWVALALTAPLVAAQEPAPETAPVAPGASSTDPAELASEHDASTPARFLIESIVVEGARRRAQPIVAAETLLVPGNSYSEAELQQALQRVERLPFVVQAELALRRGSERGRFVLAVLVTEARPVFYGGAVHLIREVGERCCQLGPWTGELQGPGLGARLFLGGQSEITAGLVGGGYSGLEGSFALFNVAYTHHNLFGRHIAGTVFLANTGLEDAGLGNGQGVQLALPLNRVSALQLTAERLHSRSTQNSQALGPPHVSESLDERVSLQWRRDTTDDPFNPRRGMRLSAALAYARSNFTSTPLERGVVREQVRQTELVPTIGIGHFWPLSRRLSMGVAGRLGRSDVTARVNTGDPGIEPNGRDIDGSLEASLSGTLGEQRAGHTLFWWRVAGTFVDRSSPNDCGALADGCGSGTYGMVSASVAARGRWGSFTLGLHYRRYVDASLPR